MTTRNRAVPSRRTSRSGRTSRPICRNAPPTTRAMPSQRDRIHRKTNGRSCWSAGISVTFADRDDVLRPADPPEPDAFFAPERDVEPREEPAFPCREAGVFRSAVLVEPLEVRVAMRATLPLMASISADLHALRANSQGVQAATRPREQPAQSLGDGAICEPPRCRSCGEPLAAIGARCGPDCWSQPPREPEQSSA